jgi:predicted glycoside hydrolase/deacetylase ChbG (UPF0249 family)
MKRLVVNADDFGASPERNDGILEAHRTGIVTAASVLVTGAAWEDAVRRRPETLDLGIHVDLSEGVPLVREQKTLTGPDGRFWGKAEARRRADAGLFDPVEVGREVLAQIDRLIEAGVRPSHLDGHQHLHVWGTLAEPVARAALARGIRWIRCPEEDLGLPCRAAPLFRSRGLRSLHFVGSTLVGRMSEAALLELLERLPEEDAELMVHPGHAGAANHPFETPDRVEELRVLTSPTLRPALSRLDLPLLRFTDLP